MGHPTPRSFAFVHRSSRQEAIPRQNQGRGNRSSSAEVTAAVPNGTAVPGSGAGDGIRPACLPVTARIPAAPSCRRRRHQQKFQLSALVPFSAVITFYGVTTKAIISACLTPHARARAGRWGRAPGRLQDLLTPAPTLGCGTAPGAAAPEHGLCSNPPRKSARPAPGETEAQGKLRAEHPSKRDVTREGTAPRFGQISAELFSYVISQHIKQKKKGFFFFLLKPNAS